MQPYELTIAEAATSLRAKKVSPVEIVESVLKRIAQVEPQIGAFVDVFSQDAVDAAHVAETELMAGRDRGPLHGIPVAVKDLFDIAGKRTGCDSIVRKDHRARRTSECVSKLYDAGAVVIGKTHTHEFAFGVMTPTTRNPWNQDYSPGGSSGGSAAAVAAGEAPLAIGTDTGGSIRGPASHCGVVGLKPTYGTVSTIGVVPCSWSLDHVGPITRTVLDSAIALNAMVAYGAQDSTRVSEPPEDATSQLGLGASGLRVGVPTSYFFEDVDPQVTTAVERALNTLAKEGAELVSVAFDLSPLYMPVLFCIAVAEAGAFHHRTMLTQSHLYGDDVRAVFEAGMRMPAHGYITGLRGREIIKREWRTILEGVDVIVAPTHPTPAPMLGQEYVEWSGRLEAVNTAYSRLTGPANICGLPSASVPCGLSSDGLPIGCQVIGPPLGEATVLRVAEVIEKANGPTHLPVPIEGRKG